MPPTRTLKVVDFTFVDISPQFEKYRESLQEASSAANTEYLFVTRSFQSLAKLHSAIPNTSEAMDTSNRIRSRAEESRSGLGESVLTRSIRKSRSHLALKLMVVGISEKEMLGLGLAGKPEELQIAPLSQHRENASSEFPH